MSGLLVMMPMFNPSQRASRSRIPRVSRNRRSAGWYGSVAVPMTGSSRRDSGTAGRSNWRSGSCLVFTVRPLTRTSPNRTARTPGNPIGAPARHRNRGRTTSATVDEGWGKGGASREPWWLRYLFGSEAQYHTPPEDRQGGRSGAPHHGPPADVHRHTDQHEAQSEKAAD